jgi:hypothetical protein
MTIQSDMALLAAGSYWDIRGTDQSPLTESNRAPTPSGWKVLTQYDMRDSGQNAVTGFSARVYQNIGSGEIVTIHGDGLIKAGYMSSVAAPLHGADVIYGGAGNDGMLGDCEGKTSDTDYLDLAYHGNDYMDNFAPGDAMQFIASCAHTVSVAGRFYAEIRAVNDVA